MEKKSFIRKYPSFCIFAVLAVLIILAAIFAPQLAGGVDPTKGSLADAITAPSGDHPYLNIVFFLSIDFHQEGYKYKPSTISLRIYATVSKTK